LTTHQITFSETPSHQTVPVLLTQRKIGPEVTGAAVVQQSVAVLTHSGTGTVRICPPFRTDRQSPTAHRASGCRLQLIVRPRTGEDRIRQVQRQDLGLLRGERVRGKLDGDRTRGLPTRGANESRNRWRGASDASHGLKLSSTHISLVSEVASYLFCPVSRFRRAVRGSLASPWSCHTRSLPMCPPTVCEPQLASGGAA
jgi:hypothetical protein